jgi:hypothetical protein
LKGRADRRIFLLSACLFVLPAIAWPGPAAAAEPLLIISGGGSPSDNAINHLENVRWLETLWSSWGPVWSLVADGKDPAPDAARPATLDPTAAFVQRLVMGTPEALEFVNTDARSLIGPATRAGLAGWVAVTGATLGPGSMLNIYVTDHGVREEGESRIVLWGDTIGPAELAAALDRLPAGVGVRFVMAQCYSGGFVDTVAALRSAGRPACGFFSTLPTRVASGCRLDPAAADWAEYSTAFFEAASGTARSATRRAPRQVRRWIDAHRHAVQTLDTVDVPIASSEALQVDAVDQLPDPLAAWWQDRAASAPELSAYVAAAEALAAHEDALLADLLNQFPWLEYPFAPAFGRKWPGEQGVIAAFIAAHASTAERRRSEVALGRLWLKVEATEKAEAKRLRKQWSAAAAGGVSPDPALVGCEEAPLPGR